MPDKETRRGFDPDDREWFSGEAVAVMKAAQEELQWLLDKGYKMEAALPFIGDHYQLSARQRLALLRTTATSLQYQKRKRSLLAFDAAADGPVRIDGFNLIITLEVALSGSPVIRGNDGVIRDLAGLRGNYRLIGRTDHALDLIGKSLQSLSVPEVIFYLDAPVSNSGRLKCRILEHAAAWNMPVQAGLLPDVDAVLCGSERVVTSDSVILDKCASWFNLSGKIIEEYVSGAWVVNLRTV